MKKRVIIMLIIILAILLVLFGRWIYQRIQVSYDEDGKSVSMIGGADGPTSIFIAGKVGGGEEGMAEYTSIDMETAKSIFETEGDYMILDVRRADEFADGHIPGAINVANEDIGAEQPAELPDLDQVIFVYSRSGRRSKEASAKLAALGYTNIYEFGGILDWNGEIEK